MSKTKAADTIWRETFDPVLVNIPRTEYRDHLPCIHLIPFGVSDDNISEADERLTAAFAQAIDVINSIVAAAPPSGIRIPTLQLVRQIGEILGKKEATLNVFQGGRLLKQVRVNTRLREECRKLQAIMLERLLLFEDFGPAVPPDELDAWADVNSEKFKSFAHQFSKGAKVDTLLQLLQLKPTKRTAIFVRNIPVCEAVCEILREAGIKVSYAHGNRTEDERLGALREFKRGQVQVLVVTRQLFGRGFDLPQADQAIFYSPKDSHRVMWQEILRIRSTVRNLKECFVLFYAWTAEAAKMVRLLKRILRAGGLIYEFYIRWSFFEEETEFFETGGQEPEGAAEFEPEEPHQQPEPGSKPNAAQATTRFVVQLIGSLVNIMNKGRDDLLKWLWETARTCGFLAAWPPPLVEMLFWQLSATLLATPTLEVSKVKKRLSAIFHPDKHPHADTVEKQFWHELFVAL